MHGRRYRAQLKAGIITDHNGLPLPCAIGSTLGPFKPSIFHESICFHIPREEILINHRAVAASLCRGVMLHSDTATSRRRYSKKLRRFLLS